jgi:putative spermidine/putrescine transport system permease protein
VAGSLIVFALSVSSFVTPALLGGPWVKVVAYLAWEQSLVVLDWPFAAAIAVILLVLTAVVMYAYNRLVERGWFAGVFQ